MDPTKIACKVYNSFTTQKPVYDTATLPKLFSTSTPEKLTLKMKTGDQRIVPVYCDITTYNKLKDLSSQLFSLNSGVMSYDEAVEIGDPFNGIGDSVFGPEDEVSRGSLKVANIDAMYKFTGHYLSLLKMRLETTYSYVGKTQSEAYDKPVGLFVEDRRFVACVVQDLGWSATNYLQFRLKNARIHSMNSISENRYFDPPSTKYFMPTNGEDGTGDIIGNWKFLVKLIRSRNIEGINLCIANGIPAISEIEQPFILSEVLVGLETCGPKATVIIKVQDVLTQFYAELLYILAQCFEGIVLFKPVMCPPESEEKYLICLERRDDDVTGAYEELLEEVFEESLRGYISSFLKEKMSEDFKSWLEESNTQNLEGEIEALERVREVMVGESVDEEYNLREALKVWSVPGDIPKNREYNNI